MKVSSRVNKGWGQTDYLDNRINQVLGDFCGGQWLRLQSNARAWVLILVTELDPMPQLEWHNDKINI